VKAEETEKEDDYRRAAEAQRAEEVTEEKEEASEGD
jgi:hypothetical protein